MNLSKSKATVLVRGKHTLFLFTATKPDGTKRDPDIARQQLAHILKVPLSKVVPNHDYEDKLGAQFCFRYKAPLPDRVRNPDGKGRFIDKSIVFNFVDETRPEPASKKVAKGMQDFPGLPDTEEAQSEGDAPVVAPITTNEKVLLELLKGQQDIMRHIQYLYEQMGLEAIKRR